jgi:uncharacterized DUF497 family protein
MIFNWDDTKNQRLQKERNISFEEIVFAIDNGQLVDVIVHPNPEKHGNQKLYLVLIEDYVYVVPFREKDNEVFLITIFPSRKYTSLYLHHEE